MRGAQIYILRFFSILLLAVMSACASSPDIVEHGFSFDARWDSRDVEILNYRYGNSNQPGARPQDYSLREGKVPQQVSITGKIPREDTLYVKWRIKTTGEVYEDTVDLKRYLPRDITGHDIRFIIEGSQLYVYLISLRPVRGYIDKEEYAKMKQAAVTPRQKRLVVYARNSVVLVYPHQSEAQETKQGE
ncbi:hypothetical protein F8A86_10445 [Betaproteobacteria bacterium SCN1]|jgi:hypothetical protein|nr:hypothetical protein F8A86_10445 [Betaproteobacteria bacterium SCN1]